MNDRIGSGRSPDIAEFIRRLGLDPTMTRRVIVDIPADGLVTVYVEANADIHAFEIDPPGPMKEARIYSHSDVRRFMRGPDGEPIDVTMTAEEATS